MTDDSGWDARWARAQANAWMHDGSLPQPDYALEIQRKLIREQLRLVTVQQEIPCACCGFLCGPRDRFRCFFCGLFFCYMCAEKHFGARSSSQAHGGGS